MRDSAIIFKKPYAMSISSEVSVVTLSEKECKDKGGLFVKEKNQCVKVADGTVKQLVGTDKNSCAKQQPEPHWDEPKGVCTLDVPKSEYETIREAIKKQMAPPQ